MSLITNLLRKIRLLKDTYDPLAARWENDAQTSLNVCVPSEKRRVASCCGQNYFVQMRPGFASNWWKKDDILQAIFSSDDFVIFLTSYGTGWFVKGSAKAHDIQVFSLRLSILVFFFFN